MLIKPNKGNSVNRIIDFLHNNVIVIIIVFVIIMGLASTIFILQDKSNSNHGEEKKTRFVESKTLYFSLTYPDNLNILKTTEDDVYYLWPILYSSLFQFDNNLGVKMDLVESYKANPDEGEVEITLKPNLLFSNGESLTSRDVEFTIDVVKDIGSQSPFYPYCSKIDDVDIKDDSSFTISFSNSGDASLSNLVFPIMSRKEFSEKSKEIQLGSGPYKTSSETSDSMVLTANESYFAEKPKNSLEFYYSKEPSAVTGLMTMGAITSYMNTTSEADVDATNKKLVFNPIVSSECDYLGFNFKSKYTGDVNIRKAIVKAIDFKEIIKDFYGEMGTSSASIYFPNYLGSSLKYSMYKYDPKGAINLLNKSGYTIDDKEQIAKDKDGNSISLTILVDKDNLNGSDIADALTQELKKIGFDIRVDKLSKDDYFSSLQKGSFDIFVGGMKADPRYDLRKMFDKSSPIGYSNEDVINKINNLERCVSVEDKAKEFQSVVKLLQDDIPYYCIAYKNYGFITGSKFKAKVMPAFFNPYRGVETWQWEKPDALIDHSNKKE